MQQLLALLCSAFERFGEFFDALEEFVVARFLPFVQREVFVELLVKFFFSVMFAQRVIEQAHLVVLQVVEKCK